MEDEDVDISQDSSTSPQWLASSITEANQIKQDIEADPLSFEEEGDASIIVKDQVPIQDVLKPSNVCGSSSGGLSVVEFKSYILSTSSVYIVDNVKLYIKNF